MKAEIHDVWSVNQIQPTTDDAGLPVNTSIAAGQRLHELLQRHGQLASQRQRSSTPVIDLALSKKQPDRR
jgi:hypothetical protein